MCLTPRVYRFFRPVFLNRRAEAGYRALASIIPGRERFSLNLSFQFSKHFSLINILQWKYSEENNILDCVENILQWKYSEENNILDFVENILQWKYSEENNIVECIEKLRPKRLK